MKKGTTIIEGHDQSALMYLHKLSPLRHLLILLMAIVPLIAVPAFAQTTGQGVISGLVLDQHGNAIPNASVTVMNTDTNVAIGATTNDTGYYEVRNLNAGPYQVSATATGFETGIRDGLTLVADGHPSVDVQLAVGNKTESVTVSGDAPLVETQQVSVGEVFSSEEISSLPNGQASMWLAMLAPGVQSNMAQNYQLGGADISWNGSGPGFGSFGRIGSNEFSLDGAANMANTGQALNLSPEESGQQSVNTTQFDAGVGHTYGVWVTQTTKAGTNDLHGGVRYRRYDLRWFAMQHFQRVNYDNHMQTDGCYMNPSSSQCQSDQVQLGWPGTHLNYGDMGIGGPVYLPKLFDGRNKMFFFVGVLAQAPHTASSKTITIPSWQETQNFDFSDLATPVSVASLKTGGTAQQAEYAVMGPACGDNANFYGQYQIFNPYSTTLDSNGTPHRQPVCGNVIPTNLVSTMPIVNILKSDFPKPNMTGTTNNYLYEVAQSSVYKGVTNRYDYAVSEKDHVFFRWTRTHYDPLTMGFTPNNIDESATPHWTTTGAAGWSHILSARTMVDFNVGATQWTANATQYPNMMSYDPTQLGLPGYISQYAGTNTQFPSIVISGYQQIGGQSVNVGHFRNLSVRSNVTSVRGLHTFRTGMEWRAQVVSGGGPGNTNNGGTGPAGRFNFDDTYDQQNNGSDPNWTQTSTGLGYASFLMGVQANSTIAQIPSTSRSDPYWAVYAGDTWRVSRKLTIVPGVRYEFEYGPTEKHDRQIVGWDPNAPLTFASLVDNAYQGTLATIASKYPAYLPYVPAHLTLRGGPIYAGVNGASRRQWENDWRVLPRIGMAYKLNEATVLRFGAGIYFDTLSVMNESGTVNSDGFSAITSGVAPSNVSGADFVQGTSPMSDPFPQSNGSRFVSPVGNTLGADYYAATQGTTNLQFYDHGRVPARSQRFQISMERQLGKASVLQLAYLGSRTTHITIDGNQNSTHTNAGGFVLLNTPSAAYYTGGNQPNTAMNSMLSTGVPNNPFALSGLASLAVSDPVYYNMLTKSNYVTSSTITLQHLVAPNPQIGGKLEMFYSNGTSQFQEFQANLSRRMANGLVLNVAFQKNYQKDRDFFNNPFQTHLDVESTTVIPPWRLTASGVYRLPFGRTMQFARTGWKNAAFGGFSLSGSYEANPGTLINFSNNGSASNGATILYFGNPSSVRIKHPSYEMVSGAPYVPAFNTTSVSATYSSTNINGFNVGTCGYTGTGFLSYYSTYNGTPNGNPAGCYPTGYNLRTFPIHVENVRSQGLNNANATLARNFSTGDHRVKYEARADVMNVFNHQRIGMISGGNLNTNNQSFGLNNTDGGNGRNIILQVLATF